MSNAFSPQNLFMASSTYSDSHVYTSSRADDESATEALEIRRSIISGEGPFAMSGPSVRLLQVGKRARLFRLSVLFKIYDIFIYIY